MKDLLKTLKFLSSSDDRQGDAFKGEMMKNKIFAYLKDETGQTSTEYILLVAVVATIVFKFKGAITRKLLGDNGDGDGGILGTVLDADKFSNFGDMNQTVIQR